MERFVKIVNSYYPLTIFAKSSVLDASQCFVYSSETFKCYSKPKHCIDGKKAYRRRSKLIPDLREVSKYLNIKRSVVYFDNKKSFDPWNCNFRFTRLWKFDSGNYFIYRNETFLHRDEAIILRKKNLCIINKGGMSFCMKFERGSPQGNPISQLLSFYFLLWNSVFNKRSKSCSGCWDIEYSVLCLITSY